MTSKVKTGSPRPDGRQIVGFSLAPELASEVKAEAQRRNIPLKNLFGEMWAQYKKSSSASKASK